MISFARSSSRASSGSGSTATPEFGWVAAMTYHIPTVVDPGAATVAAPTSAPALPADPTEGCQYDRSVTSAPVGCAQRTVANADLRGRLFDLTVGVAQLVRASGCGPGGRGFNSPRSPHPGAGCTGSPVHSAADCAPLAQRQSSGLLIHWFWVRIPGGAPAFHQGEGGLLRRTTNAPSRRAGANSNRRAGVRKLVLAAVRGHPTRPSSKSSCEVSTPMRCATSPSTTASSPCSTDAYVPFRVCRPRPVIGSPPARSSPRPSDSTPSGRWPSSAPRSTCRSW